MNKISILKQGLEAGKILQNKTLNLKSKNHLLQTINKVIKTNQFPKVQPSTVNQSTVKPPISPVPILQSPTVVLPKEYVSNVVNNKSIGETKASSMNTAANVLQLVLNAAGLFPPVGWMADIASMVISVLRQEYMDGFLSAVSIVPIAGDAVGKPVKYIRKAIKYLT